jgi:hypothetical protein
MSPRSIDDPVFGRLSLKNTWWSGEVGWQHERGRSNDFSGAGCAKRRGSPRLYNDSGQLLEAATPDIGGAVFAVELAASSTHDASAPPAKSAEFLALLRLECICIERSAIVELLYEGIGSLFTVKIIDGSVYPGAFDGGSPSV